MMPLILICFAAHAVDGDTLRCADGTRLRVAGIEANELRGGCHLPACPRMSGPAAKVAMERLVGGRDLTFVATGRSYQRITARVQLPDGRDLGCAAIRAGAAVRWASYDRSGRLMGCARR